MQTFTITAMQILELILGGGFAAAVFNKVFDYISGKRKTEQILLLHTILDIADDIIKQGYRTHTQTLILQGAYQQYKKRGGNGFADQMVNDAMAKPLKLDD